MTVVWAILLLIVMSGFFGCGVLCGSVVFKNRQVVSLDLSDRARLAGSVRDLQKTIRQMELGLRQHGHRLSADIVTLNTNGLPPAQARILRRLLEANQGFQGQMNQWADDVRRTGERFTPSVEPRPSTNGQGRDACAETDSRNVPKEPSRSDRRNERRHPFFCRQWIAPYNGVRAPEPDEFFNVQCRDISSNGISFFVHRKPTFELVVIRLPGNDGAKYLTARIRTLTPCETCEYGTYLAGCLFLGSIHSDALAPHLEASIKRREKQLAHTASC